MSKTLLTLNKVSGMVPTMRPTGRCLTPEQAAEKLNVTIRQLKEWRLRREGPRFFYVGYRRPRYPELWIDEWVNQKAVATGAAGASAAPKLVAAPKRK